MRKFGLVLPLVCLLISTVAYAVPGKVTIMGLTAAGCVALSYDQGVVLHGSQGGCVVSLNMGLCQDHPLPGGGTSCECNYNSVNGTEGDCRGAQVFTL